MAAQIMSMFSQVFANLIYWFELALEESEFSGLYLVAVFMVFLGKYLLQPLFGSAGSDKASKKKDDV